MTKYTDEQTFGPYDQNHPKAKVAVKTNGGSLTIVHLMNDGTETNIENGDISSDDAFKLDVGGGKFKATPSGGCEYEWVS